MNGRDAPRDAPLNPGRDAARDAPAESPRPPAGTHPGTHPDAPAQVRGGASVTRSGTHPQTTTDAAAISDLVEAALDQTEIHLTYRQRQAFKSAIADLIPAHGLALTTRSNHP